MTEVSNQPVIRYLMDQLKTRVKDYRESLERDEVFEIRKQILLKIKELQKDIAQYTGEKLLEIR